MSTSEFYIQLNLWLYSVHFRFRFKTGLAILYRSNMVYERRTVDGAYKPEDFSNIVKDMGFAISLSLEKCL